MSLCTISRRFGQIDTETPYSSLWVEGVKECVPSHYRNWDGVRWSFNPCCYLLVREITIAVFGEEEVEDTVPDNAYKVPRQFTGWAERLDRWRQTFGDSFQDRFYGGACGGGKTREDTTTIWRAGNSHAVLHLAPDAPWEVIQAAYRALSKMYHPDAGGSHQRMQEINAAYEELKERNTPLV